MGLNLLFGSSCYYLEVIRKGNVSPKKLIGFDDRNARLTRCRGRASHLAPMFGWSCPLTIFSLSLLKYDSVLKYVL